jgi:hypothetical protein
MTLLFLSLEPTMGGDWSIPEMPSRLLSYCPNAKYLAFLNGVDLFRNYAFHSFNFT